MFRYENGTWVPFKKKVSYTMVVEYFTDDEKVPTLDNVKITDIVLTDPQKARLEKVKTYESMSVDDLVKYVIQDEIPVENERLATVVENEISKDLLIKKLDIAKLTADDLAILKPILKEWKKDVFYSTDDIVYDNQGIFYRVIKGHTSQEVYPPSVSTSQYAKILTSITGEPLPWEQPGSTNGYKIGARVTYKGKVWTSKINNNVFVPDGDVPYNRYWTDK